MDQAMCQEVLRKPRKTSIEETYVELVLRLLSSSTETWFFEREKTWYECKKDRHHTKHHVSMLNT